MRFRMRPAILARLAGVAILAGAPAVAVAQIQQLQSPSRTEGQLNQMNSQMGQQQEIRGIEQQNQINTNRTEMQIQTAPQPVPVPVAPIGGVPRR